MSVRVILGEPLRQRQEERAGVKEVAVELSAAEVAQGIMLNELAARAGVSLAGPEGSLLIIVNGRAISPTSVERTMVRDGDRVDVEMMLSGG
jgi:hypothetical protein